MQASESSGAPATGRHRLKEECVHGHPFTVENTYLYRYEDGHLLRSCRACRKRRKREEKARKRGLR